MEKDGIFLNKRQTSRLVAFVIIMGLFIFLTGYFFGKRRAVENITEKLEKEVFADKISYSMISDEAEEVLSETPPAPEKVPGTKYYAQLVGFGSAKAADKFMNKMNNKPVVLKERNGRTAKGKTITWYQIETELFADKDELLNLVKEIKRSENLKDIRILEQEAK